MLIQRAIGSLSNDTNVRQIDWVDVTWQQCARRAFRAMSRSRKTLRVIQQLGNWLRHEDILWLSPEGDSCIAMNLLEATVLVGRPCDAAAMGRLAYEIGNLHVPMQIEQDQVIVPFDGPVQEAFERAGVPGNLLKRRFQPNCRSLVEIVVAPNLQIARLQTAPPSEKD